MLLRDVIKAFPALFLAAYAFATIGLSQEEAEGKTYTKDELDAIVVAGRFSRDLQRTKDIRPLLAKYAVPDYGLWIARSEETYSIEKQFLSEELAAKVSPVSMRDLHLSAFNWIYLAFIWSMHQPEDDDPLSSMPTKVRNILKSDPLLSQIFDDDVDEERMISTNRELARVIRTLDRVVPIYQSELNRYPRIKTNTYLSNLAETSDEGEDLYKSHSDICDEDEGCYGFPKGTPYVHVTIEPYHIVYLVRVAGKMKIVYAMPCISD